MFNIFFIGGPLMWPLLIMAIIIVVLAIKKLVELFIKTDMPLMELEYGINAILFWSIISGVFGILGQLTGIYLALKEIIAASDVSYAIMLRGYQVSFITTLFGMQIMLIGSLIWFFLRWRFKRLEMNVKK